MAYRELVRTFNQGDIALLRSVLDGEGFDYYIRDEHFNLVRPLVVAPAFMVREDQWAAAREAIQGLSLSLGPKWPREGNGRPGKMQE